MARPLPGHLDLRGRPASRDRRTARPGSEPGRRIALGSGDPRNPLLRRPLLLHALRDALAIPQKGRDARKDGPPDPSARRGMDRMECLLRRPVPATFVRAVPHAVRPSSAAPVVSAGDCFLLPDVAGAAGPRPQPQRATVHAVRRRRPAVPAFNGPVALSALHGFRSCRFRDCRTFVPGLLLSAGRLLGERPGAAASRKQGAGSWRPVRPALP